MAGEEELELIACSETGTVQPKPRGIGKRVVYRWRQFWRTLFAQPLTEGEMKIVAEILTPEQQHWFYRMTHSEQRHSLRVLQMLRQNGVHQYDLLVAALLHDVGKTRYPLSIWERVFNVLLKAFFPKWVEQHAPVQPKGVLRFLAVARLHPQWGAEIAQAVGASPLSVRLISRHQEVLLSPPATMEDELLMLLQQVDSMN